MAATAAAQPNTRRPIVFVHGMLASGDTWTSQVQRFLRDGYRLNDLAMLDWNTTSMDMRKSVHQLDSLVQAVLRRTGALQLDLVGHSAGGALCLQYLRDSLRASRIAHYAHIGSTRLQAPPPVPTLNLYSPDDRISGGADAAGVTNLALAGHDHYEVATSADSWIALKAHFSGQNKSAVRLPDPPTHLKFPLAGKACILGENRPEAGASVRVFACDSNGRRGGKQWEGHTDAAGNWGPFEARPGIAYELVVEATGKRPVHYFRMPFSEQNPLVYLRTLPQAGMTARLLQGLPQDSTMTALVLFSAHRAVVHGRDTLEVDGWPLATEALASAAKTAIAWFVVDDGDKRSSGTALNAFRGFPFMTGVDLHIDSRSGAPLRIRFNGRQLLLPRLASNAAITVAVME